MIVIGTVIVVRYFTKNAGGKGIKAARAQYNVWLAIAQNSQWRNPEDIKAAHPRASILKAGRVVFNIKGNDFRLVVAIDYGRQVVYIKWVGSHAEYDLINAETIQNED